VPVVNKIPASEVRVVHPDAVGDAGYNDYQGVIQDVDKSERIEDDSGPRRASAN
jgi:hypothetical protein